MKGNNMKRIIRGASGKKWRMREKSIEVEFLPSHYTLVSGIGFSDYALVAFDKACQDAGIGDYNLVKVSSILPSKCLFSNLISIKKGSIVWVAYAIKTITLGVGSVGVAVASATTDENGVIFEHSADVDYDIEKDLKHMCQEAMRNRCREIHELKSSSKIVINTSKNKYASAIAAVVMW
jgi:arginine decarboxylase